MTHKAQRASHSWRLRPGLYTTGSEPWWILACRLGKSSRHKKSAHQVAGIAAYERLKPPLWQGQDWPPYLHRFEKHPAAGNPCQKTLSYDLAGFVLSGLAFSGFAHLHTAQRDRRHQDAAIQAICTPAHSEQDSYERSPSSRRGRPHSPVLATA